MLKTKKSVAHYLFVTFCWIYAVISLYPLVWMLFYSFKNNQEIFVTNPFGFPWPLHTEYNVPLYFFNSLLVSIGTVVICVFCALLFAYATSRMRWKCKNFIRLFMGLGMFIPVQAIMIPVVKVVQKLNLMGTRWSLILPYVAINLAFASMVYYGFFKGIPMELEEAACMDGANIFQTFFKIIVPLVRPATVTLVIYIFLNAWNEFILANVVVGSIPELKTLPLGVLFFQGEFTTDWGGMGATMVIASFPAILVYSLFSEQVENAMTISGAVKG
jgi:raffinose/stachyose/melibiose transport system permease protein